MSRLLVVLVALALSACSSASTSKSDPADGQPASRPASKPAETKPAAKPAEAKPAAARPAGARPAEPRATARQPGEAAPKPLPAAKGEVVFTPQPGWKVEPTTSSMRKAQFALPTKSGKPLSLVVYYFGEGRGGTVEANIKRWIAQFEQPDGKPSAERAKQTKLTPGGLTVHRLSLRGTYVAAVRPGASERVREPNSRLLAAVIEGGKGPYFVKLHGPDAAVTRWEPSFDAFLEALRVAD